MPDVYTLLGALLSEVHKDKLILSYHPLIEVVRDIVKTIKNSKNYETAKEYIHLLHLCTYPLATLYYKHDIKLPTELNDVFRFENIYDEDIKIEFYEAIKTGKMFPDIV